MQALNALDIAILVVIGISVLISFMRGFVRESVSLLIWAVALLVSIKFAIDIAPYYSFIKSPSVQYVAGFITLFLAILLVGVFINMFVATIIDKTGVSATDRMLGAFFGTARGVLLVAIILMFMNMSSVAHTPMWQSSSLVHQFQPIVTTLENWIPNGKASKLFASLLEGDSMLASNNTSAALATADQSEPANTSATTVAATIPTAAPSANRPKFDTDKTYSAFAEANSAAVTDRVSASNAQQQAMQYSNSGVNAAPVQDLG